MYLLSLFLLYAVAHTSALTTPIYPTTADRVVANNYPVESHTVQTIDGYLLTMFRIPYSLRAQNANVPNKTVLFLQHGLISSSDDWILAGPDKALAYLAADAGYDVWLGNFRGITYSRRHVSRSPEKKAFWRFSFHELGIYDLPAMFEYVLRTTMKDSLHYVGHSMGTTTFMVLMSLMPWYMERIRTAHLLAPVVYIDNQQSPLMRFTSPILGKPSPISKAVSDHDFLGYNEFTSLFDAAACRNEFLDETLCANLLFLYTGFDPVNTDYSLIPEIVKTHPTGGSTNQVLHYMQEYVSGHFRQYDHGLKGNLLYYKQPTPPDYPLESIRANPPLQLYYADNDWQSSPIDVFRLLPRMGDNIELRHINLTTWNHLDYLFAFNVREVINERVLGYINGFESKREAMLVEEENNEEVTEGAVNISQ
ncbi:PREDICTED: lipase 3-like [Rhagoletis zephyria]|uniref:lipase 3-like n=1 Tax=Rhagoletis zephyria TaxID=28612 RepID=UPI000811A03F|nr:PREDICTED: lipase 3-like [Rhagoletis zephyria]